MKQELGRPGAGPQAPLEADRLFAGDSDMARRMRQFNWNATSIGQPHTWPQSLRTAVRIMLTSRQPIWIGWGKDLIYFYNEPYKSIIGGKDAWALGQPAAQVWREIWDDIGPMLAKAMTGDVGTYVEEQLLIMERHGYREETYYTFSYSPIPDDHGIAAGIICANTDDTQRVIGDRQLSLLRELATTTAEARTWQQVCRQASKALAANARDLPFALIYLAEPSGGEISLVGAAGIAADHAIARPAASQHSPWPLAEVMRDQQPRLIADLAARVGAGLPSGAWHQPPAAAVALPIVASGETGRAGVLIVGLNPFRVFDESYRGFLGLVAGQISAALANAQAYEEERRRAEVLAELDHAKTAFFSNVSHEFRTPLTLMLGPLEEALAKPDAPAAEHRTLITLAHRNGLRLLKLVNALLDFSRLESGRGQARFEAVELAGFVRELASNFQSAMAKAGLRLLLDCPPLPEPVYVDRDMWEKVVLNLLSNAFKFTFTGQIKIAVRLADDARAVKMEISDTGTGIPAEELPHLFERFRRVEGARGRSIEGSGIGLALVQELVKQHDGSITVESRVDKGSTFTVSLPRGKAHLPADKIGASHGGGPTRQRAQAYVEEALAWLSEVEHEPPTASGTEDLSAGEPPPPRGSEFVLLADDNADMRAYVRRLLANSGYRVEVVVDGKAALAAARRRLPDLILSDVMMPGLDGFQLLAKLREDAALHDVPVIFLSARAGEEAKIEGLRAGADDYLVKPFSARELLARVETNIKLAATRRESARILREEAEILELLNEVGTALAAEIDLERAVQVVTDAATKLSAAAFGSFFYNVADEKGESYTLYTLSGAPREAFAKFPMPRNTEVFSPTFRGTGIVRSPDITKDPRYGKNAPYRGMPRGHLPVCSYLAVPVVARSGEVLGGLFFGHSEPGVFGERAERIVAAIASQAAIAIDKARLYRAAQAEIERRRKIEAALRESEQGLERKIGERTAELAATNARLMAEVEERKQAEGRFQLLVDGVTDYAVYMLDPRGIVSNWNTGAQRIKGYTAAEIVGQHYSRFYSEEDRKAGAPDRALAIARDSGKFETEGWRVRKDGSRFWASAVINRIADKEGRLIGFAKVTRDVSERREAQIALQKAQEQLVQAQKMEGIGQLTGGVAHDFNNLLTIILGNLETLQRGLQAPSLDAARLARSTDNALRGAQRAAALTQRLLAFSRRQPLDPKPVDVSRLVSGMSDLLRRTIGEQIAIEAVLAGGLWRAHVDPNQLEVAILNLAVNARDAMPAGGKLTIETANAYLDEGYAAVQAEVVPGQYVVICVSDTGIGMTKQVLARAFEPFFTTKDVGQGTGLGLSQVYGFVKQSGGHIKIYSEPQQGTTVKLYLPRLLGDAEIGSEPDQRLLPRSADAETILVVEDDDDVRAYSKEILRELGYSILEAATGAAALRVLDAHPGIDLLFTDVGLPGGMNGRQLADEARRRRPDLKILFTTGYARNAIVHEGRLDPGVQLVTKPFTYAAVGAKLRDILDARARPARILLVEDEALVRILATEYLEHAGYHVEPAVSVMDAMGKIRLMQGEIDAAVVDVGLPDRRGDVLVLELRALYPALPVVIASGYEEAQLRERFMGDSKTAFLNKPYTQGQLLACLAAVREARG
ncbi:MAG TPA: response regulator [Hyphomicrobiaceae bacterium]|nr:response regulator [Hyphomicrobiaceae bacterium]